MLYRWYNKYSKYNLKAKGRHSVNTCLFLKMHNRLNRRHHQTEYHTKARSREKKNWYVIIYIQVHKNKKIPKNGQIKSTILSQACLQYEASKGHSRILKHYVGEEATDLVIINRRTTFPILYFPKFKTSNLIVEEKKNFLYTGPSKTAG